MTQRQLFGEDFPEVRQFIRIQLTRAAYGMPHTKRALGTAAVDDLLDTLGLNATDWPTIRGLAIRGAIVVAAEELRRVRFQLRGMPAISAFYALVIPDGDGHRSYVQAPVLGMNRKQVQRVWHRIAKQRDRSTEVAAVFEAVYSLPTWEQASTVHEACSLAGSDVGVWIDEGEDESAAG